MTPTPQTTSTLEAIPAPQTPTERLLYIGVILGVAAVITVGLGATWATMTIRGDSASFPAELQNAFFAALAFIFGGGIAAKTG